jgi:uncharacterized protein YkwD
MKRASVVMMWGLALHGTGSTASAATLQFERDLKQTEIGASFLARVVLDAAATTQLCVSLTSSNPALVTVPAPLTVPVGATSADFRVQVARSVVAAPTDVAIQASIAPCVAAATARRNFYVLPPPTATVTAAPASLVGGQSASLSVKLNRPAAHPGVALTLANSSSGVVSHAKALTIPTDRQDAATTLATQAVAAATTVQVTATASGSSPAATSIVVQASPGTGEPAVLSGITAEHNKVRATVGVAPLQWSAALANTAQQWANACVDKSPANGMIDHNEGRSTGYPYYVGENIFAGSGSTINPAQAVGLWASEASQYDPASNTCSGVCGHYTQIVWRSTLEVGCGFAVCPNLTVGASLVCNYAPGGNVGGQRPY